jgi:hypothetical protein
MSRIVANRKKFLTMNIMAAVGAYAPAGDCGSRNHGVTTSSIYFDGHDLRLSRDLEREVNLKV